MGTGMNLFTYFMAAFWLFTAGKDFVALSNLFNHSANIRKELYDIRKKYYICDSVVAIGLMITLLDVFPAAINPFINLSISIIVLPFLFYKFTLSKKGEEVGGEYWLFDDDGKNNHHPEDYF